MGEFQDSYEEFREKSIDVVALSGDDAGEARAMVDDHAIEFPIVYGLAVPEEADRIGAYRDADGGIIQPAGFILRNGIVKNAVYSSGPVGRLRPEESLKEIAYLRENG